MSTSPQRRRLLRLTCCLTLGLLIASGGCRARNKDLRLNQLTPGEALTCQRFIDLERAKAIAWTDRDRGDAVLDSLATAWGDTAAATMRDGISRDPTRAAAVGRLLLRVLTAEQDSLAAAPERNRLGYPLPDPDRKPAPLPTWSPSPAAPDSTVSRS